MRTVVCGSDVVEYVGGAVMRVIYALRPTGDAALLYDIAVAPRFRICEQRELGPPAVALCATSRNEKKTEVQTQV